MARDSVQGSNYEVRWKPSLDSARPASNHLTCVLSKRFLGATFASVPYTGT